MNEHTFTGPVITPGWAGFAFVIAKLLAALVPQFELALTVIDPETKLVLNNTVIAVSFIPFPPICDVIVAFEGTVQV